jgi:hypothetical protein
MGLDKMAGGKKIPELDALTMANKAGQEGAAGVDMGRNIFQFDYPVRRSARKSPAAFEVVRGLLARLPLLLVQLDIPSNRDLSSLTMVGGENRCLNAHLASKAKKEIIILKSAVCP